MAAACHLAVRPALICSGVWGGIRNRDQDIGVGRMNASLYSASADGGKGGDVYFFGVCKGDGITRLAIADVVGHGEAVSEISQHVYAALKDHMCDADSRTILSAINEQIGGLGLAAMTTAAIVAYYAREERACLSYAGHPPVLFKHRAASAWRFARPTADPDVGGPCRDVPLAVAPDAQYGQLAIPMAPGDRLFVYTDGVTEAVSPAGRQFGGAGLKRVLDRNGHLPLPELKAAVTPREGASAFGFTAQNVTPDACVAPMRPEK